MLVHARYMLIALALVLCAGCWNGNNHTIHLGTVSIGQQMIDLKAARDQEAVTQEEYDRLKAVFMNLDVTCNNDPSS